MFRCDLIDQFFLLLLNPEFTLTRSSRHRSQMLKSQCRRFAIYTTRVNASSNILEYLTPLPNVSRHDDDIFNFTTFLLKIFVFLVIWFPQRANLGNSRRKFEFQKITETCQLGGRLSLFYFYLYPKSAKFCFTSVKWIMANVICQHLIDLISLTYLSFLLYLGIPSSCCRLHSWTAQFHAIWAERLVSHRQVFRTVKVLIDSVGCQWVTRPVYSFSQTHKKMEKTVPELSSSTLGHKISALGQWFWLSWQSGRFHYPRSAVRIQSLANF